MHADVGETDCQRGRQRVWSLASHVACHDDDDDDDVDADDDDNNDDDYDNNDDDDDDDYDAGDNDDGGEGDDDDGDEDDDNMSPFANLVQTMLTHTGRVGCFTDLRLKAVKGWKWRRHHA